MENSTYELFFGTLMAIALFGFCYYYIYLKK
jgi:hypothetical protein